MCSGDERRLIGWQVGLNPKPGFYMPKAASFKPGKINMVALAEYITITRGGSAWDKRTFHTCSDKHNNNVDVSVHTSGYWSSMSGDATVEGPDDGSYRGRRTAMGQ